MISRNLRSIWTAKLPGTRRVLDALAVSITACAIIFWWAVLRPSNTSPSVTLLIAIAVSTWYGGTRSGMLSLAGGALADVYLYVVPRLTPAVAVAHGVALFTFIAFGAAVLAAFTRLRRTQQMLRTVIDASPLPIFTTDTTGSVTNWNPAAEALFGWTADEVVGNLMPAIPAERQSERRMLMNRCLRGESLTGIELRRRRKDGREVDLSLATAPLTGTDGQVTGVLCIYEDITERKKYQDQLRHQALHDGLTALPNRLLLHDRLEQAMRIGDRSAASFALLLLDVDRFKIVNDTLGHDIGDRLLQEVARRLSESVRMSDTVARLGGDEFAVLLPDTDGADAERIARTIGHVMRRPVTIGQHRIDVAASIGIAVYQDDGEDSGSLLRRADIAMYSAKRAGGVAARYLPSQEFPQPDHHDATLNSRTAAGRDLAALTYQSVVCPIPSPGF